MPFRRTPPLSFEGTREVLEEVSRPPEVTLERLRTLALARAIAERRKELVAAEEAASRPK